MVSKRFLASQYYPELFRKSEKSAVRKLTRDIQRCTELQERLAMLGCSTNTHHFTVRQTDLIFDYLGEPPD